MTAFNLFVERVKGGRKYRERERERQREREREIQLWSVFDPQNSASVCLSVV